ncbi:protein NDNF isoform X2 [Paramormyrops kingsleyae]|uniref:protein NDNF isoform X2 n=1 Tax=Paramormyrops kingsleyae TaxID=1676925 RepID=UPI003B979CEA
MSGVEQMSAMALSWYRCLTATALVWGTVWSQGSPPSNPENEVPLRPTIWLPEGKVTPISLPKDQTRRLYFTLKKRASLMSVTVIPCGVPIEWSLAARTIKDRPSKSLQWTSKKSMPEVWWRGSGTEQKMYTFKGNTVDSYTGHTASPASIYILKIKSKVQDSRVSVYLQEGDGVPGIFLEIPPDPRVHTVGVGMTSVTLSWKPSASILKLQKNSHNYHYCVLVNQKQNYKSLCTAQEDMKSEKKRAKKQKLTVWPDVSEWWRHEWDSFRKSGESTLLDNSDELQCACRGMESVCTVSELIPETLYYFDVFVVDTVNGTDSAYAGTFAQTHEEARQIATPLGEGELRWVAFQGTGRQGSQIFSFRPRGWQQSALLTLQSCTGQKVKVTVSNKEQILASEVVGEAVAQIWLQGKPVYQIFLEDMSPGQAVRGVSRPMVKMQASSAYHRQAVPALPTTLQIKSFNKLRTCNSVTLAWFGTEERSLYCMYRRKIKDGESTSRQQCLGPESRSETERVLCKYFQELNPRRAVTTATIGALEPGTAYLFDVYLMRRWGIPVKYHSKTVRTRKEC